jgi:hypothetical protein
LSTLYDKVKIEGPKEIAALFSDDVNIVFDSIRDLDNVFYFNGGETDPSTVNIPRSVLTEYFYCPKTEECKSLCAVFNLPFD